MQCCCAVTTLPISCIARGRSRAREGASESGRKTTHARLPERERNGQEFEFEELQLT